MAARRPSGGLLTACCIAAGLVLLPLGVTVWNAADAGGQVAAALLWRPLTGFLLFNTLRLIACAVISTGLIGTGLAWAVERTDLKGKRGWSVLAVVPLAIPPFITSYAWVSLSPGLENFWGALLVVTVAYYPLVYLPVAAALREMDPALEETARSLGLDRANMFFRIILPQLRPALLGGVLLVALDVLVEFGAFALLRYRTFTTAIYGAFRAGFSGAEPALLSMILLLLCIACLTAEFFVRGGARYGRLARGARRRAASYPLGRWQWPAQAAFFTWAALTIGVPVGMILYWLGQPGDVATAPVAATFGAVVSAAWTSVSLGAAGASVTMVLALPLGVLAARYQGWLVTALERAAYLAQSIPGIVVALALVSLTVHALRPLYESTPLLVAAYSVLFLPLALVSVRAALTQAQPALEEAGKSLGLGRMAVLLRVSLPLAAPGLGAAAALVFISVTTELTATLLLAPIGTQTLATQIWADTSTLAFAGAAPYAAAMAAMSMAASWLLAGKFGAASVFAPVRPA